jgi:drug/metabolite transporter (DMT)-like permease
VLTAATICYINALRHTSVADVAVLFAVAPLITAGLGWLCLGVREMWSTVAASLVAMIGVTIIVGGALTDGHLFGDFWSGRSLPRSISTRSIC